MLNDSSFHHEPQTERPMASALLKSKPKFHLIYLIGSLLMLALLGIMTLSLIGYWFFIPFVLPYFLFYIIGLMFLYNRRSHAYGLFLIQAWATIVFGIAGFTLLLLSLIFMFTLVAATWVDLLLIGLYYSLFILPLPVLNACAIPYYSSRKHWFKPAVTKG